MITSYELSEVAEKLPDNDRVKSNAQLLIDAINDYPILNLKEPIDFLNELKNKIGIPLTFERISLFEKQLTFDKAWIKESLSSILAMFYLDKSKTLDDLIEDISKYYKKQS